MSNPLPLTSPDPEAQKPATIPRWFGFALVVTFVAILIANAWETSFVRAVLQLAVSGQAQSALGDLRDLDHQLLSLAKDGNLAIQSTGFDDSPADAESMLPKIYYRGVYTLYPQRIFVGEHNRIVNNGRDMATLHFNPDNTWLRAHEVRAVLSIRRESNGQITVVARALPSVAPNGSTP